MQIVHRAVAVMVALVVVGGTACSASDTSTASAPPTTAAVDVMLGRPHAVETRQLTFVDGTRTTPEGPGGPAEASRTLEVWLTLPEVDGPTPLVVLSHGMAGHPRKFEDLARAWAEAGYAVAAPVFPRSNADMPSAFTNIYDVGNQPADVVFVLDQLLALSADPASDLAGRFDPDRVGAAGHSAGGYTTYRVAVDEDTRDHRFVAAVAMAAPGFVSDTAPAGTPRGAVLLIHGDRDPLIAPGPVVESYLSLAPPKHLVTLLGAGHAGPFEDDGGLEPKVPGHDQLITDSTIAFWDRYLLGDTTAETRIARAGDQPALATYLQELR